jgi:hypothetical protein
MAGKGNRDLEHRIDGFYALCEKILLHFFEKACPEQ